MREFTLPQAKSVYTISHEEIMHEECLVRVMRYSIGINASDSKFTVDRQHLYLDLYYH